MNNKRWLFVIVFISCLSAVGFSFLLFDKIFAKDVFLSFDITNNLTSAFLLTIIIISISSLFMLNYLKSDGSSRSAPYSIKHFDSVIADLSSQINNLRKVGNYTPVTCRVPDDRISQRSYPLLASRELIKQFIQERLHVHQAA